MSDLEVTDRDGPIALLESTYDQLGLREGSLHRPASTPGKDETSEVWSALGDWLLLADRMGADRVFFVNDEPVVVFAVADEIDLATLYRQAWSMARPRLLVVAVGGELRVYGLDSPPRPAAEPPVDPLAIVQSAADVAQALNAYQRDRLETGYAFAESKPGKRADDQLLADVRTAAAQLCDEGLSLSDAHSLLERAILIRYLEDRGALKPEYFLEVASQRSDWLAVASSEREVPVLGQPSQFLDCLADRELTFAILGRLARDFNGDLFRSDEERDGRVSAEHFALLARLLGGELQREGQRPLFLWAYDFSVVPTSLINTMYELFHHSQGLENSNDTHYTSAELVELVLGDVLDEKSLSSQPVVCDPACGSGAFLVEAYRRIVRFEMARNERRLSADELTALLVSRIRGIDIDGAAVRLAAFGLYLALLNHLDSQDIESALPLPKLVRLETDPHEAPLTIGDAFPDPSVDHGLFEGAVDVVVGNPPWSEPPAGEASRAEDWARRRGLHVANRSPSALFCWRALDLLAEGGTAALLVNSGILRNRWDEAFRKEFLGAVRIEHVIDFAAARHDFFVNASAPFVLMRFSKAPGGDELNHRHRVVVERAERAPQRSLRGSLAYLRLDRRLAPQAALRDRPYLWKTYLSGGPRDQSLLARLELEVRLETLIREPIQFGLQRGPKAPSQTAQQLQVVTRFKSWGPLEPESLQAVPTGVKWEPNERLMRGHRILVRTGVAAGFGAHARLFDEPYAFRHDVLGVPVGGLEDGQPELLLGHLLSSLGRYWTYMQSPAWGYWRPVVSKEAIKTLPVRLDCSSAAAQTVIEAVRALPTATSGPPHLLESDAATSNAEDLLGSIDRAMYKLFDLTMNEQALVEAFWLRQRPEGKEPLPESPVSAGFVDNVDRTSEPLAGYLATFLHAWNRQLGDDGRLDWSVARDRTTSVAAAIFRTRAHGDDSCPEPLGGDAWRNALGRLGNDLDGVRASRVVAQGVVRAVVDDAIVIVKRDERSLWTAAAAEDDFDATFLQAMALQRR